MTEECFAALAEQHKHSLWVLALALTRSHSDAEDALQEALITAFVARDQLEDSRAFLPWVRRILVRQSSRLYRRVQAPVDPQVLHSLMATKEDQTDMHFWELVLMLPDDLRKVVALRYLADMSQEEAARVLGIRVGTVKSRLNRALNTLRRKIRFQGRDGVVL